MRPASVDHAGNRRMISWDGALLLALITGLNFHLAGIGTAYTKIFLPAALAEGQWWRLITFPFVHISWYHLLLDAGAFFILYGELTEIRTSHRFFCLMCSTAVSLAVALLFSPMIETLGLGGLSGTAHGLMAFCGLKMMNNKTERRTGQVIFWLVVAKSIWEAISGQVVFGFMHMGLCGAPQAACHLGGVLGGTLAFLILRDIRMIDN